MVLRGVLLMTVLAGASGCATLWTVLEVTGADWGQSTGVDHVEPLGPIEERVVVTGRYQAPTAGPVDAPPPSQVLAPELTPSPGPQPVLGRPLPQGGVALHCEVARRPTRERRYETVYRYDAVWRVLAGFFALSEGAFSALLSATSVKDGQVTSAGALAAGIYLGLDALGTVVLAFHPAQKVHREREAEGTWKRTDAACPEGLGVEVETGTFPVLGDGHVPELEPWMLQHLVETSLATLRLQWGPQRVDYAPTLEERCAWSDLAQSPAPFCAGVARGQGQGSAVLVPP